MKQRLITFIFIVVAANGTRAQNPCTGAPSANNVVPASQSVCSGGSVVMGLGSTYSVTGIAYQWQVSLNSAQGPFTNVTSGNQSTYASGPTFTTGAGTATLYYQVQITCTNSGQTTLSQATVYVVPCSSPCSGTPAPTSIVPSSYSICEGASPTLSLSTSYTNTGLSFQWGTSGSASGPFTAVPGATQTAYAGATLSSGVYYFNVTITCTNSSASTSAVATVSVSQCHNCFGTPGSNSIMPVSQTICAGQSATMTLANYYPHLGYTYQWGSSTISQVGPFTAIAGATATSYTTVPLNATTYFNVSITCTTSGQSITALAVVHVSSCASPCTGTPAPNSVVPANHTVCVNDLTTMSLSTTYTTSGITFQWQHSPGGGPMTSIPGATNNAYTTGAMSTTAIYQVVITCTNSGMSSTIMHSVAVINCTYCAGPASQNTMTPLSGTVCAGASPLLGLVTSYTLSGYAYQWSWSSVSTAGPFTQFAGANSHTFVAPPPSGSVIYYLVVITCTNSGQTRNVVGTLSVVPCPGQCTTTPASNSIIASSGTLCMGQSTDLSLANSYTAGSIAYQWASSPFAGGPYTPINGATSNTLNTGALFVNFYYQVAISCTNGGVTSTAGQTVTVSDCSGLATPEPDRPLSIVPNPGAGKFVISGLQPHTVIRVYNLLGAVVYQGENRTDSTCVLDMTAVKPGLYYVEVTSAGKSQGLKLIKQ
jgi:hypothetical protein